MMNIIKIMMNMIRIWKEWWWIKSDGKIKPSSKEGDSSKVLPLDHPAEEIQAGYNCRAQAHCCNYHDADKSKSKFRAILPRSYETS